MLVVRQTRSEDVFDRTALGVGVASQHAQVGADGRRGVVVATDAGQIGATEHDISAREAAAVWPRQYIQCD